MSGSHRPPTVVLASTSRYRRELLERLRLPFRCEAATVDESRLRDESPEATATRLAIAKARAVANRIGNGVVIGSDQVAVRDESILGKPGSHENAIEQLRESSGRSIEFLTAVCVLDLRAGQNEIHVDHTRVHFRELTEAEIRRYVELDRPYDCAGGFKVEKLGIALFDRIDTEDPTALIGLPLIWLAQALARIGIPVFEYAI